MKKITFLTVAILTIGNFCFAGEGNSLKYKTVNYANLKTFENPLRYFYKKPQAMDHLDSMVSDLSGGNIVLDLSDMPVDQDNNIDFFEIANMFITSSMALSRHDISPDHVLLFLAVLMEAAHSEQLKKIIGEVQFKAFRNEVARIADYAIEHILENLVFNLQEKSPAFAKALRGARKEATQVDDVAAAASSGSVNDI